MINLRYHIVSLTAVFLALIIGILMGTTVVSKATVDGLRSNLQRAEARSEAVHQRNGQLSSELSNRKKVDTAVDKSLTDQVLSQSVDGVLDGVPVVIIASSAVDDTTIRSTVRALSAAGADLDGTLVLDDRLAPDKIDTERLADVLGVAASSNVTAALSTQLAAVFAQAALVPPSRIPGTTTTSTSPPTTTMSPPGTDDPDAPEESTTTTTSVPAPVEPDLINALRHDGFLDFQPLEGRPDNDKVLESDQLRDGVGYRYVILSGADPKVPDTEVLDPLIAKLARIGSVPVVAASAASDPSGADRAAFIGPLLKLKGVNGQISTVDNLESFAGTVALVYALHEGAQGHFGNYGVGDAASTVIPTYQP